MTLSFPFWCNTVSKENYVLLFLNLKKPIAQFYPEFAATPPAKFLDICL